MANPHGAITDVPDVLVGHAERIGDGCSLGLDLSLISDPTPPAGGNDPVPLPIGRSVSSADTHDVCD